MLKIPESIRIAGADYKVIDENVIIRDNIACLGYIDYHKNKIQMEKTAEKGHDFNCRLFLHEVLHGIAYHYNIELPEKDEEIIIDQFAIGLYQVLQDNAEKLFDIPKYVDREQIGGAK